MGVGKLECPYHLSHERESLTARYSRESKSVQTQGRAIDRDLNQFLQKATLES